MLSTSTAAVTRPAGGTAIDPRALELVGGVRWVDVPGASDARGELAFLQVGSGLPFVPQRVFYVYGVPAGSVRGQHAHKLCEQVLVCVRGQVRVVVDDGHRTAEVVLDDPRRGLHLPAMVFGTQRDYSADAVLLVLASHPYDAGDYLTDHAEFTAAVVVRDAVDGPA